MTAKEDEEFNLKDRPLARRKAEIFARKRKTGVPKGEGLKRIAPAGSAEDAKEVEDAEETVDAPPAPPAQAPARSPAPARSGDAEHVHMVDVGAKPVVPRRATAEGFLRLKGGTLGAIRDGRVKKGDPFPVAETAGVMAAKKTPDVLPLCHPIPLTGVDVRLTLTPEGVRCEATVSADYKTGVEMEALTVVTIALLTVWDMTKYLEKDENGQYPGTRIENVRVLDKRKG